MQAEKHPVRGILAGIAGGLVAAWSMNVFSAGPGKALTRELRSTSGDISASPEGALQPQSSQTAADRSPEEASAKQDATMKAADSLVEHLTGGRHLTFEQQQKAGPIVHYAFGVVMGGLYGGLAEYFPLVRSGFGTTFGSVLFGGADMLAVPALHLSGEATDEPAITLATPFAAHLVYGVTTELIRRIVRKVL